MSTSRSSTQTSQEFSKTAGWFSFVASAAALAFLAALHILSPEFDPAWRMVSEYALGDYPWVLSLMFVAWALGSWALALALRPQMKTLAGKIGLAFLVAAGIGEAMAAVFDIQQDLHGLAAIIGIGSLPVAAMLISVSLGRNPEWSPVKRTLLWTANLTWLSIVLMAVAFAVMIGTFTRSGGGLPAEVPETLPPGVIALVGWANRLLVLVYCVWAMIVARHVAKAPLARTS